MADANKDVEEESSASSIIRREARSEGYLLHMSRESDARDAARTRSYSTSDSDELEDRLQERPRLMSLTDIFFGRRSFFNTSQPVVSETVLEETSSVETLTESDGLSMSTEISHKSQVTLRSEGDPDEQPVRETTQTDHLNKRLLDSFLSRLGHIAGIRNPGTVYHDGDGHENIDQESGDYSTVYSDDLLMDRIYRRMNSRNGNKK